MRFRRKFGPSIWIQVVALCFWAFVAFASLVKHHAVTMFGATCILGSITATIQILAYHYTFWQLDAAGLYSRNRGSSQLIPYAEIVSIRPHEARGKASPSDIDIEYGQIGSSLNPRAILVASPADRTAFLEKLRASTPHAAFEF